MFWRIVMWLGFSIVGIPVAGYLISAESTLLLWFSKSILYDENWQDVASFTTTTIVFAAILLDYLELSRVNVHAAYKAARAGECLRDVTKRSRLTKRLDSVQLVLSITLAWILIGSSN